MTRQAARVAKVQKRSLSHRVGGKRAETIKTDSHHEWESAAQKDGADLHSYSTNLLLQLAGGVNQSKLQPNDKK